MKNALFSTWRNIRKRKLQTFIQIGSLTLAFAIGIILFLSASFELSFDHFHNHIDRIGALYFQSQEDHKNHASYLDENTDQMYEQEQQMMKIISVGGVIAVIIACMGLFAAALVAISTRVKEIGIRKVLGSSIWKLVILLSKDFLQIVLIALLIGLPIAWYLPQEWLNGFSYRLNFHFGILFLCALAVLALAAITIGMHTIKAASTNPVNALKDE